MPSIGDSVFIFVLALMLFGPKNLPKLARQLGKLMAEFRRASNEFRMQMEDELRVEEQKEHQAKVDAMAGPPSTLPEPDFTPPPVGDETASEGVIAEPVVQPIAQSGELKMMPPSTGLPVESASFGTTPEAETPANEIVAEHTILPPEHSTTTGISSEEPAQQEHTNA
jgi:sec-independent protein translocase protein TatB